VFPLVAEIPMMLPKSPRPRAAEDFPAIRARMEELQLAADKEPPLTRGLRPYGLANRPELADKPNSSPMTIRRLLAR
jgi:hypothetical protein